MWKYGEELYHWGIPGMKWGFRKAKSSSSSKSIKTKKTVSADYAKVHKLRKKKVSQLSNEQLKEINNRKNLERQYKSFKPQHIKTGIAVVTTTGALLGGIVAIKKNGPEVLNMGKKVASGMRNIRLR